MTTPIVTVATNNVFLAEKYDGQAEKGSAVKQNFITIDCTNVDVSK